MSAEFNLRLGKDAKEKAGTLIYMAPEQIALNNYSKKVDIWPCGIIMYQLLTCGKHPYYTKGEGAQSFIKKMREIEHKPLQWKFPDNFTPLAKDFFLKLCSYPPNNRYDAQTALQHPWLTRNSRDEIPLTKTEEVMSYAREVDLRKAMRIAYFTAQMKLQFQNQARVQEEQTKHPESTMTSYSNTFPIMIYPSEFQSEGFLKYKELLLKNSSSYQDSTSADSEPVVKAEQKEAESKEAESETPRDNQKQSTGKKPLRKSPSKKKRSNPKGTEKDQNLSSTKKEGA